MALAYNLRSQCQRGFRFMLTTLFFLACGFLSDASLAAELAGRAFTVVLDSGHTPKNGGALGARGVYEVEYNDQLTAKIAQALQGAGIQVVLTRKSHEEISLDGRVEIANKSNAQLFLAVHHDSAQLKYLNKTDYFGKPAYQAHQSIAGYSIFVSQLNAKAQLSLKFGQMLGRTMHALGRPPTLHHAEAIAGENRELLSSQLGLYRFDELLVLRKNTLPAVLLEAGVIVDVVDEKYVSSVDKQSAIAQAVVAAVMKFRLALRP